MKKLYLLFVMCLTTIMLSASGVEVPHKAKMSPVPKKAVMDMVSPGYGLGGAQDTIRIDVAGNVTVYSEVDEDGNKRYIFYAEADSNQIVIMANMEDLVTGVYDNIEGYCVRPNHMPVYGVSGNVNLQVGYAISTIVGTFLGSDGNIYVITGHFPTPRIYTINVRVPACGEYEPAVISPAITDFSLPMTFEATTGWYTASFPAVAGVQYAIVDKNNQDNVPVHNVNGDWWPMFGPSSMNTLGDTTTLYYDWSDTIEYRWLACLQQTNPGDNDQPIEDGYIHFWGMSINKNIVSATNEMFSIQLTFRNMNNLMPGFYTSQQNQFNLNSCWIQDQMTGQRETAQMIDAEVRDNNGSLMLEATIITQTGMMYQVRLFAEQQIVGPVDPVDPTPGDSTEVEPGETIPEQPITPSERDYTIRVLPPYGNYQPALYFTQQGTMQQLSAGNDGWYSVVLHHEVDYDYQSFRVVENGNINNYIERNVWGEWYDMSAGIIYDDTTTVITLDYSAENYRWHADAPVVVPDTIRIDCTSEYTTTNYGSDIVFAASNSLYATQLDIYMTEVTPGTYTSANGDFDLSYTIVRDNQTYNYVYASAAEATLRQEGDIMYLTCMMTGQDGKIYLINMQKSLTVQIITIDCPNEFAYREYADDDMVVAATTDDYYVQLNFATNNVQPGTYTNEHFLMQYTALFTSSQQPITGASEITANVTVENGVTYINAEMVGDNGNTYLITMHGVLPNNAVEPSDSTEVVPGDSTIIVPNDSVAPGTRNYMVRIATPTCGNYQPALYFEEDQLTVPMMQENSGWYRAILNHEIDYSYHSFNVVENNNPNNKIEMNAWVEWFEASAGIVYDDTTTIISLNYSDTVRFRWSACNEEVTPGGNDSVPTVTPVDTIRVTTSAIYSTITNGFQLYFSKWNSAISKMYSGTFNFTGDMLGNYTSGNTSHYGRSSIRINETKYLQSFDMSFVETGNRSCQITITALDEDNTYYEITLTMRMPYPHTYEISILPPACMDLTPEVYCGSSFPATLNPNTDAYVAHVQGNEGAIITIAGTNDGYYTGNSIQEGMGGYFNNWSMYLDVDTVLFLDLRTPVVESWGDTTFYRWTECGDDYRVEPEHPSDTTTTSCGTLLWEGMQSLNINGIYVLTDGGYELMDAGAEVGDYVRFYVHMDDPFWWVNVYEGHYGTQYIAAWEGETDLSKGYIDLLLTESIMNEIQTQQYWGGSFLVMGEHIQLTGISLIKPECHEEPVEEAVYIQFTDPYVLQINSDTETYISADGNLSARLYFLVNYELPDGEYTTQDFNTGYGEYYGLPFTYLFDATHTYPIRTITARVTTVDNVKYIHVFCLTTNGRTYILDMQSETEPVTNEIVINCTNEFTWRGSTSDAYFEADGDGYHVQFNFRSNNLTTGFHSVDEFWTGSYTYVQPNGGNRINSTSVSALITRQGHRTHVELLMECVDGNTYRIHMWGINPGAPYEPMPGDTISLSVESGIYLNGLTNSYDFELYGSIYNNGTMNNLDLFFSGDVWGENSMYTGTYTSYYGPYSNRVQFTEFTSTELIINEDHTGVMHVIANGTDSLIYDINFNFHLPYPHTYTVSVLAPEDCEQAPVLSYDGRKPMVYDSISGRYTLTLEAKEGLSFLFANSNSGNTYIQEVRHFSDSYYEPSASTYLGHFTEDTVMVLDLRHPVLAVNRYSVDTIFYKWSNCDTYNTEFVETETGYGLVVRKPYTLDASKAAELSPASVHLYYTLPVNNINAYLGTPEHGQLFITDSVDLHLSRFVKDDVLGRVSAFQRAIQDMQNPGNTFYASENSLSSALINQGNVTADTIQQHTLFSPEQWHFMALPFDAKRSDIQLGEGTYAAIRRFLPAEQAAGNYYDVWEDLAMSDTIHAGEGYIYQFYKVMEDEQIMPSSVNEEPEWVYGQNMAEVLFTALPTANKQRMFVNSEQTVALNHHAATYVWNKNWNLISNPYESFYNVHNCGSNGIITVYGSGSDRESASGGRNGDTYSYISLNDDYYVLRPGEAFFYQAADNEQSITFPLAGCQLTANPDSAFMNEGEYNFGYDEARVASRMAGRDLYNFYLSDGTNEDRARVVINPSASMDYEVGRDALKLTPFTLTTPLFYVEDEYVQMAINERPMRDGIIYLSAQLPAAGTFSIRLQEKTMGTVMLLDTENGTMTNLSEGDYIFNESAGTYNRRFIISIIGSATDLQNAASGDENVIKILENNRVYIIRSGEKYDVLGNRIDK